jgi:hypothetical protein
MLRVAPKGNSASPVWFRCATWSAPCSKLKHPDRISTLPMTAMLAARRCLQSSFNRMRTIKFHTPAWGQWTLAVP